MRAIVTSALVLSTTALLGACEPQAPSGDRAPPPADAPATPVAAPQAFAGEMLARGTEPFWALRIKETEMVLERPDFPPLTAPNPGPVMVEGRAVWRTQTEGGAPLEVILWEATCSDGMSDLVYGYEARVTLDGRTLSGCAGKADAMPREGT